MTFYVIVTGQPKKGESGIALVDAASKKEAYEVTSYNFRKRNNLRNNVALINRTVFESEDENEAIEFHMKVFNQIREAGKVIDE